MSLPTRCKINTSTCSACGPGRARTPTGAWQSPPCSKPTAPSSASVTPRWCGRRPGALGESAPRPRGQHYLDATSAARAAEGWTGSTYAVFENTAREIAVLVRTRWDDATEAAEWVDAYADAVKARYGATLELLEDHAGRRTWRTRDGALLLGRDGAETVLALAPTPVQVGRLAALQPTASVAGLDLRR